MLSPENELCNTLTRNHEAKRLKRTVLDPKSWTPFDVI